MMPMPTLLEDNNISRDEVVNLILTSIGMEEVGLSHMLNAEGEKLQYALGTFEGVTGSAEPLKIVDLLNLNQSVRDTLGLTIQNQLLLNAKLGNVKSIPTMQGPTGAAGSAGPQCLAGSTEPVGTVLDSFESLKKLEEKHPTRNQGDAYLVAGTLYVWNTDTNEWKSVGSLINPEKPSGPQGDQGPVGTKGTSSTIISLAL